MRCASEVHEHYKACKKMDIALMSTLLTEMREFKNSMDVVSKALVKNASEGEKAAPAAQEPSVNAETRSTTIDGSLYYVKQETVLVPESDYLNKAVTNLVGNVASPPVNVKVEPAN
jgi:hypothetical protein